MMDNTQLKQAIRDRLTDAQRDIPVPSDADLIAMQQRGELPSDETLAQMEVARRVIERSADLMRSLADK